MLVWRVREAVFSQLSWSSDRERWETTFAKCKPKRYLSEGKSFCWTDIISVKLLLRMFLHRTSKQDCSCLMYLYIFNSNKDKCAVLFVLVWSWRNLQSESQRRSFHRVLYNDMHTHIKTNYHTWFNVGQHVRLADWFLHVSEEVMNSIMNPYHWIADRVPVDVSFIYPPSSAGTAISCPCSS